MRDNKVVRLTCGGQLAITTRRDPLDILLNLAVSTTRYNALAAKIVITPISQSIAAAALIGGELDSFFL